MNRRAATQITADAREEFAELREQLSRHLDPDADVDQARRMLADHVQTIGRCAGSAASRHLAELLNGGCDGGIDRCPDGGQERFLRSRSPGSH